MNTKFAAILKSLKLPVLSPADITTLQQIQREWQRHNERIAELLPYRIGTDQKAAYTAFLDSPSAENEQRLAVLAVTDLTGKRHKLLSEAYTALRLRANQKAADIIRPLVERISKTLYEELQRREDQADLMEVRKRHDPRCIEVNWAIEHLGNGTRALHLGTDLQGGEIPPLEMAVVIMPGKEEVPAN